LGLDPSSCSENDHFLMQTKDPSQSVADLTERTLTAYPIENQRDEIRFAVGATADGVKSGLRC